jgi:dihydrofolate synthase / folylpolyglutamate synthase
MSPQEQFLLDRIDYERMVSMPCSEEAFKLDRMRDLLDRLGNPQQGMPIVHVAGTKGKGSTAAMMASVLKAAGFHTGLFTSPHLDSVEERIVIDGQSIAPKELAELVDFVRPAVEAMEKGDYPHFHGEACENETVPLVSHSPTYFEIITAAALCYFARRRVDAAVLEVGLGGRLDSTNVCSPCVSIITSISLDHTKQLGETLAKIAAEKAGIIKPGVPVISGVTADEPREVVRRIARQNGCRIVELGVDFDFEYHAPQHLEQCETPARFDFIKPRPGVAPQCSMGCTPLGATTGRGFMLRLLGRHQAANAALTLAAVEELRQLGWAIPEESIRHGLADVTWPARIEVVARRPTVVLDAAHNAASIEALVGVLAESFSVKRRFLIFATTQEKDIHGMLETLLGAFDEVIFTRYQNNPRGVPPEELQATANEIFPLPLGEGPGVRAVRTRIAPTPAEAWDFIRHTADLDDLICITGSFFIAAEMRRELLARPFP